MKQQLDETTASNLLDKVGIVVIGRNEGERLERCLHSVVGNCERIVYVDSGSTDGSVEFAQSIGARVVELDTSIPFSMGRARNTGFEELLKLHDRTEFVQFVDGDCEVFAGWLEAASRFLASHPGVAAVTGRRQERSPEGSIYNRLVDMELRGPAGEVTTCGGDVMIRASAFEMVGGFNSAMIAGEEPELCCRLRLADWKIHRIEAPLSAHDAAITRFSQWWKRTVRSGHAYAEGADLQGRSRLRHNVRELKSILFWGVLLPTVIVFLLVVAALLASFDTRPWSSISFGLALVLCAGYPLLVLKVYRSCRRRGFIPGHAALYAGFCVLGKFPEAHGVLRYALSRNRNRRLIEYKD